MKRFYKSAAAIAVAEGHAIGLDGRPIRTPEKRVLTVPSAGLAAAIAEEWNAQPDRIEPLSMPLTQLANTALDRVPVHRDAIVDEAVGYAATELLCYRVDRPPDLVARQRAAWDPLLDWAAIHLDAPFRVTTGIVPIDQDDAVAAAVRRQVAAFDDHRLAALHLAVGASGSIIVTLALFAGRLDAGTAVAVSQVDERYQLDVWGADDEAEERLVRMREDIEAAARFVALLPPSG